MFKEIKGVRHLEGIFLVFSHLSEHVKDEVPPADDADEFGL